MKVRRASNKGKKIATPDRMKSREEEARLAKFAAEAFDLKIKGWTRARIAEHLGVTTKTVGNIWERGFAEYIEDHKLVRDRKFAEILAGHESMIEQWSEKAKTDPEAARVVLRARVEMSRMCGHANNHRVEHSGIGGGPIVTVNATPMEAARAVREAFGGNVLPFGGRVTITTGQPEESSDDVSEYDETTEH